MEAWKQQIYAACNKFKPSTEETNTLAHAIAMAMGHAKLASANKEGVDQVVETVGQLPGAIYAELMKLDKELICKALTMHEVGFATDVMLQDQVQSKITDGILFISIKG